VESSVECSVEVINNLRNISEEMVEKIENKDVNICEKVVEKREKKEVKML